jgi:hypothetical protein
MGQFGSAAGRRAARAWRVPSHTGNAKFDSRWGRQSEAGLQDRRSSRGAWDDPGVIQSGQGRVGGTSATSPRQIRDRFPAADGTTMPSPGGAPPKGVTIMPRLRQLAVQHTPQFAMVLVAAGTWLAGCGDDAKPPAPRGKGGSAGMAGSAGAATGGTGGSAGSQAGGTAGSAGSTGGAVGGSAGSAGSAGKGTAGNTSGGEGGDNQAGGGGTSGSSGTGGTAGADQGGQGGEGGGGGEGGASASMCSTADLDVVLVSATGTQRHDHLPVNGTFRTTLLGGHERPRPHADVHRAAARRFARRRRPSDERYDQFGRPHEQHAHAYVRHRLRALTRIHPLAG